MSELEELRSTQIDQLEQLYNICSQTPGGATRAKKLQASLKRMGVNIPQSNTQQSAKRQRWAQTRKTTH